MAMQYDVVSKHAQTSTTLTTSRVRVKNITVTSGTSSLRNIAIADPTVYKSGTYSQTLFVITVSITAHGLTTGDRVFLDVTSGTGRDAVYAVTVTNANTFTVTSAASTSTSGNATIYTSIALELDTYSTVGLPILIPGEGILMPNGVFAGVGSSVTMTVYYG